MNHLKVSNSVAFVFTTLHPHLGPEHFHHPKRKLQAHQTMPARSLLLVPTALRSVPRSWPILDIS